jgi:hypothetical protein
LKRFKISSGGYYFWVHLFDQKQDMFDWYEKYAESRGREWNKEPFGGICIPYEWIKVNADGTEERKKDIGTVLLHKGQLGMQTICHEMGHCAFWYDRLINGNKYAVYGPNIEEEEERVLYLLAEFTRQAVSKIQKLGYKITAGFKIDV